MSRDRAFGLGLCAVSLLAALAAAAYFAFSDGHLPLAVFVWPALGFIVGIAIAYFSFVETGLGIDDEIEQFPHLVEDDIRDLRQGRISTTHFFVVLTVIAALIEFGILLWYRKESASWGPLNVFVTALAAVAITLALTVPARWFQNRQRRLAPYVFLIPFAGWLICMLVGIRYAEPMEYGGMSALERSQLARSENYWPSTRAGTSYFIYNTVEGGGSMLADMDCDGEECLVMILIVVVIASVLASAYIPHFWVVATLILLTLMAVISLRELLYNDDYD